MVKKVPNGCDQQGRYPEAAHCATELCDDDCDDTPSSFAVAVILAAVALGVGLLFAWAL